PRVIHHPPTRLLRPEAPVLVLAVHEEPLVQQADLRADRAARQQAGADHRVDLRRLALVEERQIVAAEAAAAREEAAQPGPLVEVDARRLERAAARRVELAVRQPDARAEDPDRRAGLHVRYRALERAR